jgi:outer membrane protein assembly factor BamB
VVHEGLLFEGEYDCCPAPSAIRALDVTTGQVEWTYPTQAPVVAPAAVTNGTVFAGDYDGTLYALDEQTGVLRWEGALPGQQFFDPDFVTVAGGVVYTSTLEEPAGSGPGTLAAWSVAGCGSLTCEPLWTATVPFVQSGAAVAGSSVFVASGDGTLSSFSTRGCLAPPCSPQWTASFPAGGAPYGSIAVARGVVYVSNVQGGEVAAFPAAGCTASRCDPSWAYDTGPTDDPALAVWGDRLFVGTSSSLRANPARCPTPLCSTPVWTDPTAPRAKILVANGVVFAIAGDSVVADSASTGRRLWRAALASSAASGPAVADGSLYVAVTFGWEIDAFGLPGTP